MASRSTIPKGRSSTRGARQPRADEVPTQLEMTMVAYLRAPVNHHNHFHHDGTHDPEVTHVFDGSIPLFLNSNSQERIEAIRMGSYKTLQEIITDAKFSVPHEDGDRRFTLLVIKRQVSLFLQHLVVPRLMLYNLTNREDGVKIGILKHGGVFCQEGLFRTNIIGLRPGFVNEDAPVNVVVVIPNTYGNELAKIDAQYPDADARFHR
ncbi:uncharacterized protein A4U43_C07F25930 [Asparagus officinalis]|uniref:Uncharacterized protein n=1 Tax=Asparagus officinalis TaxID=4686 RepID=A0A5P1EEW6_ASPOF|nr:uncharacterized protein A4U43_C07F25930 [Asparagus officinalis]